MAGPHISLITPVYNTLEYLSACVDSILAQTFPDFELILVDDGSTDGSETLCDNYAARDPRVVVIHQANQRQAAARNHGLDAARGQYIAFADSDDEVAPDYLEKLYLATVDTNADVSVCGVKIVPPERDERWTAGFDGTVEQPQILRMIDPTEPGVTLFSVLWNKLYRASLFRTLRFTPGRYFEDDLICHHIFCQAKRVTGIPDRLYIYKLRAGSTMDAANQNERTLYDRCLAMQDRIDLLTASQALKNGGSIAYVNDMFLQLLERFPETERRAEILAVLRRNADRICDTDRVNRYDPSVRPAYEVCLTGAEAAAFRLGARLRKLKGRAS